MALLPASASEWEEIRERTRNLVASANRECWPDLRLEPIGEAALDTASGWQGRRHPHWDWRRFVKAESRRRFELAIWLGDRLCGLALGPVGVDSATLSRLERDPAESNPLKGRVASLALLCLETQARALGLSECRIEAPAATLLEWYRVRGYGRRVFAGFEIDYVAKDI